jgi:hypothetical protein
MAFQLGEHSVTIVGYADAYDPETATIYDLKTTRFVKWQEEKGFIPRESHVAQVQCYYTLLDLYGIPVQRLVLVYADDQTILPKQVPLGSRKDWMIKRATTLHRALQKEDVPQPEIDSRCTYCSFIKICPRGAQKQSESEEMSREIMTETELQMSDIIILTERPIVFESLLGIQNTRQRVRRFLTKP